MNLLSNLGDEGLGILLEDQNRIVFMDEGTKSAKEVFKPTERGEGTSSVTNFTQHLKKYNSVFNDSAFVMIHTTDCIVMSIV